MTRTARAGALFVVLFIGAFMLSLGELLGSFADGDHVFVERFADEATRVLDIAASYLLALAALVFAWFSREVASRSASHGPALKLSGYSAAGGMLVAAVAAATTPLSIWFGALVDDPGIEIGVGVLPQFAYVALTMGALLPAGVFIITAARSGDLMPPWLAYASYPVGALVAIAALAFMPLFLFPIWMLAFLAVDRRTRPASD
jgi:hypothetical protein